MKKSFLLLLLLVGASLVYAQGNKQSGVKLTNKLDSANYTYGMHFGNELKRALGADLNMNILLAGLNDALGGAKCKIETGDANAIYEDYDAKVAQPRITESWKTENAAFLEENKKRKEVVTTSSGLQYEVLHKGSGTVSPKATDKVEVHYHGTLIDGQVFDSSVRRGKTSSFALNQVIRGWTEGLQFMHEGDKFRFYIPYDLAYGERDRGNVIKGYSTLIFDVELFNIEQEPSGDDNKALGMKFLEENKKRPEVKTTASGLQYEILKKGDGKVSPGPTDKVEVHYHGTLIDGKVFDSSVQRGETIAFGLNQVIRGWTEGVQLMSPGAKYTFYIPYNLAYGERGTPGGPIPGFATLIFDVELVNIK